MTILTVSKSDILTDCNLCIDIEDDAKGLQQGGALKTEYISLINLNYSNDVLKLYNTHGLGKWIDGYLGEPFNKNIEFQLKKRDDKNRKFTTQIRIPIVNDILKCLNELKLCDVDLGSVTVNDAYVLNKFQNVGRGRYNDGDDGVMFAPIDFNNFSTPNELSFKDLRPLVSDLFILQRAAAQCGVCFDSPVMQSIRERHSWSYWLKTNWWEYEGKGKFINATGSASNPVNITGTSAAIIPINTEVSDIGNNLDVTSGFFNYTSNYEHGINVSICINAEITNNAAEDILITFYGAINTIGNTTGAVQLAIPAGETRSIDKCMDYYINTNDTITMTSLLNNGIASDTLIDITFNTAVVSLLGIDKHMYKGDEIIVNSLLDCNKTALDVLKSNMQLYSGLLDYDSKNLFMSTPYSLIVDAENVEGYFKGFDKVISLGVECFSKSEDSLIEVNNNVVLCFADSSDNYISTQIENGERSENESENGIFSVSFELGTNNTKDTENCNPHIEPTLNRTTTNISNGSLWIPVMIDSDSGINSDINPRKLYIYNGIQELNGNTEQLVYEGTALSIYPTAYQGLEDNINITGNPEFNRQQLIMSELYELYCKDYYNKTATVSKDRFFIALSYDEYKRLSFRNRIKIPYIDTLGNYSEYIGILKKKRFNSCGKIKVLELSKETSTDC